MRRNKIALFVLSAAVLVVSACSSPTAPAPNKICGTTTGGQICK